MCKTFVLSTAVSALLIAQHSTLLGAETVSAYLSAPFTQSARGSGDASSAGVTSGGYANALVETFDDTGFVAGPLGSDASSQIGGTFTSTTGTNQIDANGEYGGGGQGNYLGVNGTVTLTFSVPVLYLGLEWCAVDGGNSLTLYDQNNALIGTYNASTFSSLLPNNATSTITAINGTKYNTSSYIGQPTGNASTDTTTTRLNGGSTGQQYAYLNFIPGGTTASGAATEISKVVMSETGATFESDNYAVLTTTVSPLGSFVPAGTVPEPSSYAMVGLGLAALGTVLGRRRSNVDRG